MILYFTRWGGLLDSRIIRVGEMILYWIWRLGFFILFSKASAAWTPISNTFGGDIIIGRSANEGDSFCRNI